MISAECERAGVVTFPLLLVGKDGADDTPDVSGVTSGGGGQLGETNEIAERREGSGRRETDSEIAGHFKAADTGLTIAKRWIDTFVWLVGFGILIGMSWQNNSNVQKSLDDFKAEIRGRLDQAATATAEVRELRGRVDDYKQQVVELKATVAEDTKIVNAYAGKVEGISLIQKQQAR
jgi:hypothetical protein